MKWGVFQQRQALCSTEMVSEVAERSGYKVGDLGFNVVTTGII